MKLSVELGLLLALATAMASVVGFLFKHRGAASAPPISLRRPLGGGGALLRSRTYVLGLAIAMASWGLHVAALAMAPISLVQSVIAGGLVFLTVIAQSFFGIEVSRREWAGVVVAAVGLSFLAATLDGVGSTAHSGYQSATLAAYAGGLSAIAVALALAVARGGIAPAAPLAVSAGLMWGASDVSIKALSGSLGRLGVGVLIHPLAAVILTLSLVGMSVSARSLQIGPGVAVIAATSAAANLTTIAAGPIVFGEPLPGDALGLTARLIAFLLVVIAAALTPAPTGAVGPVAATPSGAGTASS